MGIAPSAARRRGFGLLELLLTLALGVPLSILMIQLFALAHRSSILLREEAFLRHSARVAFQLLQREIRQAGYGLCPGAGAGFAAVVHHRPQLAPFFEGAAVRGFGPGAPPPAAWAADALPGSDSILLRRGAGERMRGALLRHNPPYLHLAHGEGFHRGAAALLSDAQCQQVALLQLRASDGLRLDYGPGGVVPGNCASTLGGAGDCGARDALREHQYAPGSEVLGWRAVAYYVGAGADGVPALFRERLFSGEAGLGSRAEAAAPAVEDLRILYAVDAGAQRWLQAAQVGRLGLWPRVRGARLQLRLRSRIPLPRPPFSRPAEDGEDLFLRRTLRFSVALRNGAAP